jgi:N-terminal domain of anti-restriction factor ArdC
MTNKVMSKWTGSQSTSDLVRRQIAERWGAEEAKRYDPRKNCLTFSAWRENGCIVRKGEKAIKSFIVVEKKDKETGEVVAKHLKSICLFYEKQVEAVNA